MEAADQETILQKLRHVLQSHALTIGLSKRDPGEIITTLDIIQLLKQINPAAQHREGTWKTYAERMGRWLSVTGYLIQIENDWKLEDQEKVNPEGINKTRKITVFIGDTSPAKTVEALDYFRDNQPFSIEEIKEEGFRNAATVLRGLRVVKHELGRYSIVESTGFESKSSLEVIWDAACSERTLQLVIDYLQAHPAADGKAVGGFVNQKFRRNWSASSKQRVGRSLCQWASWVMKGMREEKIPEPPGHTKIESKNQLTILGLEK